MRTFNNSFFSKNGIALTNGSIAFYEKGDRTQKVNVYKPDETTQHPNPMPIVRGRAGKPNSSIMLPNKDVEWVAYDGPVTWDSESQEYVCSGNVVDTGIDNYRTTTISAEGVDIPTVDTIASLQTWHGMVAGDIVCSLGYYAKGDREPVFYQYTTSTLTADGGHIVENTYAGGYWVSIDNGNYIDSMLYGVKGEATQAEALVSEGVSKLASASAYSATTGKPLHINTTEGLYIYVPAGTYNIVGKCYVFTNNNQIVNLNTDDKVLVVSNSTYKGRWSVRGDVLRTSNLIIDDGTVEVKCSTLYYDRAMAISVSGARINFSVKTTHSCTFSNCELNSIGKLYAKYDSENEVPFNTLTINNCRITQEMLDTSNFDTQCVTLNSCPSDVQAWTNGTLWYWFNNSQSIKVIDMNNMSYGGTWYPTNGCVLKNATLAAVYYNSGKVKFENCVITTLNGYDIVLDGCTVTNCACQHEIVSTNSNVTMIGTSVIQKANITNGSYADNNVNKYKFLTANGAILSGYIYVEHANVEHCNGGNIVICTSSEESGVISDCNVRNSTCYVTIYNHSLAGVMYTNVKLDRVFVTGVTGVAVDKAVMNKNEQGIYELQTMDSKYIPDYTYVSLRNVPVYTAAPTNPTGPWALRETVSGVTCNFTLYNVHWSDYLPFGERTNANWPNNRVVSTYVSTFLLSPTSGTGGSLEGEKSRWVYDQNVSADLTGSSDLKVRCIVNNISVLGTVDASFQLMRSETRNV